MVDVYDDGPIGKVEKQLPRLGASIEAALRQVTDDDSGRIVFTLFVVDAETATMCWTSTAEPEGFRAALADWLAKQAH